MSLTRTAGFFVIMTVAEPRAIMPGPPGTQPGSIHGRVWSPMMHAGIFPIMTVGAPGPIMVSGKAGCGAGVGTGAGG